MNGVMELAYFSVTPSHVPTPCRSEPVSQNMLLPSVDCRVTSEEGNRAPVRPVTVIVCISLKYFGTLNARSITIVFSWENKRGTTQSLHRTDPCIQKFDATPFLSGGSGISKENVYLICNGICLVHEATSNRPHDGKRVGSTRNRVQNATWLVHFLRNNQDVKITFLAR